MAKYRYICKNGHEHSYTCPVADMTEERECPECDEIATRIIGKPLMVAGKDTLPESKRRQFEKRLIQREERIAQLPADKAEKFRQLSKIISGDRF